MTTKLKGLIYGIFGLIITIITIRILILFIGVDFRNSFVSFWMNFSNIFVNPWMGIAPNIQLFGNSYIELTSVIAIGFYLIIGLLVEKSTESIGETSTRSMLISFIDSLFKIAEFLLATRLVLKLFGVSSASTFAQFIYSITQWIITPFGKFMNDFTFGKITIEISTIVVLIIIVILDIGIDEFFRAVFKRVENKKR